MRAKWAAGPSRVARRHGSPGGSRGAERAQAAWGTGPVGVTSVRSTITAMKKAGCRCGACGQWAHGRDGMTAEEGRNPGN